MKYLYKLNLKCNKFRSVFDRYGTDNILIDLVDVVSFDDIDHLNKKIKELTYNINDSQSQPKEPIQQYIPNYIQPESQIPIQPYIQIPIQTDIPNNIQPDIPNYIPPKEPESIQPYIPTYIQPSDTQPIIDILAIKKKPEQRPIINSKKPIRSYGSFVIA